MVAPRIVCQCVADDFGFFRAKHVVDAEQAAQSLVASAPSVAGFLETVFQTAADLCVSVGRRHIVEVSAHDDRIGTGSDGLVKCIGLHVPHPGIPNHPLPDVGFLQFRSHAGGLQMYVEQTDYPIAGVDIDLHKFIIAIGKIKFLPVQNRPATEHCQIQHFILPTVYHRIGVG